MPDREKVIKGLNICARTDGKYCGNCPYTNEGDCVAIMSRDVLELLKEHENLLKEYEKLSQVCFKIEKYLRIADLSILIDRIEEGEVEVLQDDGRPDFMETTIKIRRK